MITTAEMLYEERTQEIHQQLDHIKELMKEHMRETDGHINYAHAGDLAYLRSELQVVINFMEGKDD